MSAVPKLKVRGFEICRGWEGKGVKLPEQATRHAAGYDFRAAEQIEVPFGSIAPVLVPTGVKAYMRAGEFLLLANRSSNPKRGLMLANGVGIVDQDYYGNPSNDGEILFAFWNVAGHHIVIEAGERIGQGIFVNHLKADGVTTKAKREAGFGSTGI